MKNGIHIYVDPSTLQPEVGHLWIPLPETGIADLAPEIADVLRPACGSHDFKPPSDRDFHVPAATWGAVLVRAAEIVAANAQIAKEKAEREEREKAERAERTVKWREAAARYLAGEEVIVDSWSVDDVKTSATNTTDEERGAVRAEYERRARAYQAKVQAEREAQALAATAERETRARAILTSRTQWLADHGYTEAAERAAHGVLPELELRRFLRAHAPTLEDIPRYTKRTSTVIEHRIDCQDREEGDVSVSWAVTVLDSMECSAGMWSRLKAIRAFYADVPNTKVEIREHTAVLSCNCPDPSWYGVLVTISYPEMDISIGIEYDLG